MRWKAAQGWLLGLLVAIGGAAGLMTAHQRATFDHYVLSLSWSPQYCATDGRHDEQQCGTERRYGFIVHGLWPQYGAGAPQECAGDARVGRRQIDEMLDIMPSARLIRHQWTRHGLCSGLSQREYFTAVRDAYEAVRIPREYQGGRVTERIDIAALRSAFLRENPRLSGAGMALRCRGAYLAEVRICVDKDLRPRACRSGMRSNCGTGRIVMRSVR